MTITNTFLKYTAALVMAVALCFGLMTVTAPSAAAQVSLDGLTTIEDEQELREYLIDLIDQLVALLNSDLVGGDEECPDCDDPYPTDGPSDPECPDCIEPYPTDGPDDSYTIEDVARVVSIKVDPILEAVDDEYVYYRVILENDAVVAFRQGFSTLELLNETIFETGFEGDPAELREMAKDITTTTGWGCFNNGYRNPEGTKTDSLVDEDGNRVDIADATFVCGEDGWEITGGLPSPVVGCYNDGSYDPVGTKTDFYIDADGNEIAIADAYFVCKSNGLWAVEGGLQPPAPQPDGDVEGIIKIVATVTEGVDRAMIEVYVEGASSPIRFTVAYDGDKPYAYAWRVANRLVDNYDFEFDEFDSNVERNKALAKLVTIEYDELTINDINEIEIHGDPDVDRSSIKVVYNGDTELIYQVWYEYSVDYAYMNSVAGALKGIGFDFGEFDSTTDRNQALAKKATLIRDGILDQPEVDDPFADLRGIFSPF